MKMNRWTSSGIELKSSRAKPPLGTCKIPTETQKGASECPLMLLILVK